MTEDEIRHQVRSFLSEHLRNIDIADDEDLFGAGLVNSLFAMQVVLFVEKAFGLAVENDDLDLDNFRSIDALVALVSRKLAVNA
jgi:methoxymalonate biosynthesis acyl carrier protein